MIPRISTATVSNLAIVPNGDYVLVGFNYYSFRDNLGRTVSTWAPVLGAVVNGQVTALYRVNRSDISIKNAPIILANQQLKPGELGEMKNNSGDVPAFISQELNAREGANTDFVWMTVVFNAMRNKVFHMEAEQFLGKSRAGKEYRVHVYKANFVAGVSIVPNPAQLMALANTKGWKADDLVDLDGMPITEFADARGTKLNFDANGFCTDALIEIELNGVKTKVVKLSTDVQ